MLELEGPIKEIVRMPYNQERITALVRRILREVPNRGMAAVRLIQMHGTLERGVSWIDGPGVSFHSDGSRTSRFTLTRGIDVDPMTIDVRVTAEEIEQAAG